MPFAAAPIEGLPHWPPPPADAPVPRGHIPQRGASAAWRPAHSTHLSRGSTHVVFLVVWSMKNIFPSTSRAMAHPSGRGISPFRFRGIFHTEFTTARSAHTPTCSPPSILGRTSIPFCGDVRPRGAASQSEAAFHRSECGINITKPVSYH